MKKQILFALAYIFVPYWALSQTYLNQFYHFNPISDTLRYTSAAFTGIINKNDTLIIEGQVAYPHNPLAWNTFYAEYDTQGNLITFKHIDSTGNSYYRVLRHTLHSTFDRGYISTGIFDLNSKWRKGFLAKLKPNLDIAWVKEFEYGDTLTQIIARDVIELSNTNILSLWEIWYNNASMNTIGTDIMLIETDSNGVEVNRKIYGYPLGHFGIYEQVSDMLSAPWGILIGGAGATNPTTNKGASFIIKLDSTGNKIGDYFTSFSDSVNAQAFAMSNNGFIGLCGRQGFKELALNTYDGRCYIAKYNSIFGKIWGRKLPENFFYNDFYKMIGTYDNGFLACGRHETNAGWMVKVSQYGQVEWSRKHQVFYDWNWQYDHYFYDVVELPDKGFALVGTAYDNTQATSPIVTNAWLARTDSFGCLVPGCETVGIAENTPLESSFKLYPNPASDRLFLYYNNPHLENCVFAVRDLAGRQLVPPTPLENSTTYEMRIGDWAKGLYFVEVRDEKGNVFTQKFIKD